MTEEKPLDFTEQLEKALAYVGNIFPKHNNRLESPKMDEAEQKRRLEEDTKDKEQRRIDQIIYVADKSIGDVYVIQTDTFEQITNDAKTSPIWRLKKQIDDWNTKIQKITEKQQILKNTTLSPEARKQFDDGKAGIEISNDGRIELISRWMFLERVERDSALFAVLEVAKAIYRQRIEIDEKELLLREANPQLKETIAKMKELAKRATKIRPIVVQANREAWVARQNGEPSIQLAKTFSDNLEEFQDLQRQYECLLSDIQFLTDTANVPPFPSPLTTDEISSRRYVEQAIRRSGYAKEAR